MKRISHFDLASAEFLLQLRLKEMGSSINELKQLIELSEFIQKHKTTPASSESKPLKEGLKDERN